MRENTGLDDHLEIFSRINTPDANIMTAKCSRIIIGYYLCKGNGANFK